MCGFNPLNGQRGSAETDGMFTSKPCSRPTFIMSLQRFGTKHITSTAFCSGDKVELV